MCGMMCWLLCLLSDWQLFCGHRIVPSTLTNGKNHAFSKLQCTSAGFQH